MARDHRLTLKRGGGGAGTEGDDTEATDASEAPSAEGSSSLDDLIPPADVQQFDRTFSVGDTNLPFAGGESPAIPGPYEGIPRVALVYSLSYEYDTDAGGWTRATASTSDSTESTSDSDGGGDSVSGGSSDGSDSESFTETTPFGASVGASNASSSVTGDPEDLIVDTPDTLIGSEVQTGTEVRDIRISVPETDTSSSVITGSNAVTQAQEAGPSKASSSVSLTETTN